MMFLLGSVAYACRFGCSQITSFYTALPVLPLILGGVSVIFPRAWRGVVCLLSGDLFIRLILGCAFDINNNSWALSMQRSFTEMS